MSFDSSTHRPIVDTYDSGYEYSLEHLLELAEMLMEPDEKVESEPLEVAAAGASAA